jgi:iron complex transport system substrate-binding protein
MKVQSIFFLILLFFSCKFNDESRRDSNHKNSEILYAQGFNIIQHADYKELAVINPWKTGEIYARYYLVKNDSVEVPSNGIKVRIPVTKLAITSSTHIEFLHLTGDLEKVSGVCSPELIYNTTIRDNFCQNKITSLGDAFNINVEKTLNLKPEILIISGYNQHDSYAQRISDAGIPVIFNNEWMEKSLLARAEWIKFMAAFTCKDAMADSIFKNVENQYIKISKLAADVPQKPTIISGSGFRGTWYMPGGNSFMAQLFKDAGGSYFYASDTTRGSLPLNMETVINHFAEADVWLNCSYNSMQELIDADKLHGLFRPAKTGKVYNFNNRILPSGANDYWESAVARPDLLLSDVIYILHPELLPGYKLVYAKSLK